MSVALLREGGKYYRKCTLFLKRVSETFQRCTLEEGEQQQETISRGGEQIDKHEIAKVFCHRGSQTRLRSKSISKDAESLNSHF